MELPEVMETRGVAEGRERTFGGPAPRRPSRRTAHVSSTTYTTSTTFATSTYRTGTHTPAHQVISFTPVVPYSPSLRIHRLGKQPTRMKQGLQPPSHPTAPPPVLARRASRTNTSHAATGYGHGYDRCADAGSVACVWVYGYYPASRRPPPTSVKCQRRLRQRPRRTCVHILRTRTAQL